MRTPTAVFFAFFFFALAINTPACPLMTAWAADQGKGIDGVWFNQEKDAKIEIYGCGDKFCGKVIWAKEPKLDVKNPKMALRARQVVGLQIMEGFSFKGNKKWAGGKIYDPKSGNTYSGTITLVNPDELKLRGYVLFSLFGRTDTWTRVEKVNKESEGQSKSR